MLSPSNDFFFFLINLEEWVDVVSSFFLSIFDQFYNSFPPVSLHTLFPLNFYAWYILLIFSPLKPTECTSLHWSSGRGGCLEIELDYFRTERHCMIRGLTFSWAHGHLISLKPSKSESIRIAHVWCLSVLWKKAFLWEYRAFFKQIRLAKSTLGWAFFSRSLRHTLSNLYSASHAFSSDTIYWM